MCDTTVKELLRIATNHPESLKQALSEKGYEVPDTKNETLIVGASAAAMVAQHCRTLSAMLRFSATQDLSVVNYKGDGLHTTEEMETAARLHEERGNCDFLIRESGPFYTVVYGDGGAGYGSIAKLREELID